MVSKKLLLLSRLLLHWLWSFDCNGDLLGTAWQFEGSSVRIRPKRFVSPEMKYIFSVRNVVSPKVKKGLLVRQYKSSRQPKSENNLISLNIKNS